MSADTKPEAGWLEIALEHAAVEAGKRYPSGSTESALAMAGLSTLAKVREPLERIGKRRLEALGSALLADAEATEGLLVGGWDAQQAAVLIQLDDANLSRLTAYDDQQDWKAIFAAIGGGAIEGVKVAFRLLSAVGP